MKFGSFLTLALLVGLCAQARAQAGKKIGVLMWLTDQARFVQAKDGVLHELARAGYKEPATTIIVEDVMADKAKAAPAVERFLAAKVDLIVAVGTHAAMAAAERTKTTPIIFTLVNDPIDAKLIKSWEAPGGNVTGTSTYIPMDEIISRLTAGFTVKKMLVLYTPGEKQTELNLKSLQELKGRGIEMVPFAYKSKADLPSFSDALKNVDSVYFTPSVKVSHDAKEVVDATIKAKVRTFAGIDEFAAMGVMVTLAPDSYVMGTLAGKKAVAVMGGTNPGSVPSEYPKVRNLVVNLKSARAAGITVPSSVTSKAANVIE